MSQADSPEITFQLWPPKLIAKGTTGIRAVARPLRLLLYVTALCSVLWRLAWFVLVVSVLMS